MRSVLIIGIGKFGKHLALKLKSLGDEVCIVDNNPEKVNLLSSRIPNAYVSDCTHIEALKDLGAAHYDVCVVAIGENFQSSLEITALLKELKAKKIVAKANSTIQSKFLKMAGADEIVYPEQDTAEKLALRCDTTKLYDFIQIGDKFGIYEFDPLKIWIDHSLKDLNVRNKYHINIVAIKIENDVQIPTADYVFTGEEHVFAIAQESDILKLTK